MFDPPGSVLESESGVLGPWVSKASLRGSLEGFQWHFERHWPAKMYLKPLVFCNFGKIRQQKIVFCYTFDHHENERLACTRAQFSICHASKMLIFAKSRKCHFGPLMQAKAEFSMFFQENPSKTRRSPDASFWGMSQAKWAVFEKCSKFCSIFDPLPWERPKITKKQKKQSKRSRNWNLS